MIPKNLTIQTKEWRLPAHGRVRTILSRCSKVDPLPRTKIPGTEYSSAHIALVEILGLCKRIEVFTRKDERPRLEQLLIPRRTKPSKVFYSLTAKGREALRLMKHAPKATVVVPIKVNSARYEYHKKVNW